MIEDKLTSIKPYTDIVKIRVSESDDEEILFEQPADSQECKKAIAANTQLKNISIASNKLSKILVTYLLLTFVPCWPNMLTHQSCILCMQLLNAKLQQTTKLGILLNLQYTTIYQSDKYYWW